jgi:hypothetical protein
LVSSIRSLLWLAESVERSLPARSITYSTPGRGPNSSSSPSDQGLTLVHFSAQRKHFV